MNRQMLSVLAMIFLVANPNVSNCADDVLDGTRPLQIKRPLDEIMVDGINAYCLDALARSVQMRDEVWARDYRSTDTYLKSVAENREEFRRLIGAIDDRVTTSNKLLEFELLATLNSSSIVAKSKNVTVHAVRWQVLEGVTAEGLLLQPKEVRAAVVALPDANWPPEIFTGIFQGIDNQAQLPRRLAEAGCLVIVPTLIDRRTELSGHPEVVMTNQPHREFLYRQAFEVGRHPLGYEVQKTLAAIDLLERLQPKRLPIGVAGVGEGALLALYSAALDRRIDSTLVSGYFQKREAIWTEPIYRNVWRLLTKFGDAELAGLVAPRRLVIEACRTIEIVGQTEARSRRKSAAPGSIVNNKLNDVRSEFDRANAIYRRLKHPEALKLVISGSDGHGPIGSSEALSSFAAELGIENNFGEFKDEWVAEASYVANATLRSQERQRRQFNELQTHVQSLLRKSHKIRNRHWKVNTRTPKSHWDELYQKNRKRVHEELIGRFATKKVSSEPRSRMVLDTPQFLGYEVMLDVTANVVAGGILLVPKDLKQDERRPVVVCQHGLEALAMDTISRDVKGFRSYKAFAANLCERGFIVYSPQNPYRGFDRFRSIQRKANPLGLSLFSFIIAQHKQTLDWLASLSFVDEKRIAFYGLSYGGKTAMRVPPFVDRYCLSICSGDFTDWVRSIATNEERYGYAFTSEYEIPEWNMAHVASYAELAMLMTPRPFMVEQGHLDGGAPAEWVMGEYGKVRRHYDLLGIGGNTEIEFFNGPHTINGVRTIQFLHKHLRWP